MTHIKVFSGKMNLSDNSWLWGIKIVKKVEGKMVIGMEKGYDQLSELT